MNLMHLLVRTDNLPRQNIDLRIHLVNPPLVLQHPLLQKPDILAFLDVGACERAVVDVALHLLGVRELISVDRGVCEARGEGLLLHERKCFALATTRGLLKARARQLGEVYCHS